MTLRDCVPAEAHQPGLEVQLDTDLDFWRCAIKLLLEAVGDPKRLRPVCPSWNCRVLPLMANIWVFTAVTLLWLKRLKASPTRLIFQFSRMLNDFWTRRSTSAVRGIWKELRPKKGGRFVPPSASTPLPPVTATKATPLTVCEGALPWIKGV